MTSFFWGGESSISDMSGQTEIKLLGFCPVIYPHCIRISKGHRFFCGKLAYADALNCPGKVSNPTLTSCYHNSNGVLGAGGVKNMGTTLVITSSWDITPVSMVQCNEGEQIVDKKK